MEISPTQSPRAERGKFAKGNKIGAAGRPASGMQSMKDRLAYWYETKSIGEIERIIKNKRLWKKLPSIDAHIAQVIATGSERTGLPAVQFIWERLLGKAPQAITGEDGAPLIPAQMDIMEIARRMAYTLSLAATQQIAAPTIDNDKVVSEANSLNSSDENKVKI